MEQTHDEKPQHEVRYEKPMIEIRLQPEDRVFTIPRVKTVRQLFDALQLGECCALVARDGMLLTPDREINAGDSLLVRKVASSG